MSAFSDTLRARVMTRAGSRCEYCHLPTRGQVATFPIDHIIPRTVGGVNNESNLALACPHCNAHKWTATEAVDAESGATTRLFHPRSDDWSDHFAWSKDSIGELLGKTAVGRVTVTALNMNAESMIALRCLLAERDLFDEVVS